MATSPTSKTSADTSSDTSSVWTELPRWIIPACHAMRNLPMMASVRAALQDRNELSTPITSFTRLKEGYYLASKLHQSPYEGGSFHQAPLLLLLGPLATSKLKTVDLVTSIVWLGVDIGTAFLLGRIAQLRKRSFLQGEGEEKWDGWKIMALYLLHPFAIATGMARSTIVFNNFFVALAVWSALNGSTIMTAFALSFATHLSLYPALLLPPLILLLHQSSPSPTRSPSLSTTALITTVAFAGHQLLVLILSYWATGGWDFLSSVYGTILSLPDLTPTIGLSWYFFIEMFDYFRAFFVGVFQLHVVIYVAPLTIAFRKDPFFAVMMMVGIISIFKSYPSLGDFALSHTLLACYSELFPHLSRPFFLLNLTLYSLFLLPTFHHLWLYSGSGNANFFYASTLVWTISQGGLLVDILAAKGRREVLRELGEEGRKKVREGKWELVQR